MVENSVISSSGGTNTADGSLLSDDAGSQSTGDTVGRPDTETGSSDLDTESVGADNNNLGFEEQQQEGDAEEETEKAATTNIFIGSVVATIAAVLGVIGAAEAVKIHMKKNKVKDYLDVESQGSQEQLTQRPASALSVSHV